MSRALDGLRDLLLFLGGKPKSFATLDLAVVGHQPAKFFGVLVINGALDRSSTRFLSHSKLST